MGRWRGAWHRVIFPDLPLIGYACEAICGHRPGAWLALVGPGRFEQARCRVCRQRIVRPRVLHPLRIVRDRPTAS